MFIILSSFKITLYAQENEVNLIFIEPNIVELSIPKTDYRLTIEVSKIIENSENTIVYSAIKKSDKPTKCWWVSKPGKYILMVSRKTDGKKVTLQEENFYIN